MIEEFCRKCGFCDFTDNQVKDVGELVVLKSRREIDRFFRISAMTANSLSYYEKNHHEFLSIILQSEFDFNQVLYYILDEKFKLWMFSIIELSELLKQLFIRYALYGEKCMHFFDIIECEILDKFQSRFIEKMEELKDFYLSNDNYDENSIEIKIIEYFVESHNKLYEKFKEKIKSLNQPCINGDYDNFIRLYTIELTKAMELTVVEAASINRLLVDETVYLTYQVVDYKLKNNFDLIKTIVDIVGIKPKFIKYSEEGLERFEVLYEDLLDKKITA